MLQRISALLLLLVITGQALAGGFVCSLEALNSDLSDPSACILQDQGDSGGACEMACCALGKSPTGSIAAMTCCEIVCGESTSGAQFNFTPQTVTLAPPVVAIRVISLVTCSETESSPSSIRIRSAENHLRHHHPPDLFLSQSAFLI